MNYPLISEYVSAILSAEDNFDQLNYLQPVLNEDGTPVMTSGNFAVVFKMKDSRNGRFHAVKCFIKEQEGRAEAYKLIAEELNKASISYCTSYFTWNRKLTSIQFFEKELFVDTGQTDETEFPVLLMDWENGSTLDRYLREHLDNRFDREMLAREFSSLMQWLLPQPFAHGDLKPDNILVRDDGSMVLVDYDGMYVPAMKGQKARELGSPDYRHPFRTEKDFDEHIDDFPAVSILLSLVAIAYNPEWFYRYGSTDRLLLGEKDYRTVAKSECIEVLTTKGDTTLNKLLNVFYFVLARNNLTGMPMDLLKISYSKDKVSYSNEMLFTKVTEDDIRCGVQDEYGCLFSSDGKRLLKGDEDLISYRVPEGTVIICDDAFSNNSKLRHVTFPRSLTHVGRRSFCECSKLEEIEIQGHLYFIGTSAFANCCKLETISFEDVIYVGDSAFQNCLYLKEIYFGYVEYIGNFAFQNCFSLTSCDFWGDGVEYVGEKAFFNCKHLLFVGSEDCCEEEPTDIDVVIGNSAFEGCDRLKSIHPLGKRVSHIGAKAFFDCKALKTASEDCWGCVDFERVRYIGECAFANCKSLSSIHLCSVLVIADSAFKDCTSLKYVYINKSVDYVGLGVFDGCRLFRENSVFDDDEDYRVRKIDYRSSLFVEKGYGPIVSSEPSHLLLLSGDARKLQMCLSEQDRIVLPSTIENIGFRSFAECKELKEIFLPDSVRVIESGAFINCKELYSINIPDGVTKIENCAFARCECLQSIDLPEGIDRIEQSVFEGCKNLSYISIPQSVKKIEKKAFASCENVDTVELHEGLEIIGDYAFYDCKNLESIDIPEGTSSIGDWAFAGCTALSELELPNSVKKMGDGSFRCCRELQNIVLPSNIEYISSGAFAGCWSLELINIPTSVHTLGTWVEGWVSLDLKSYQKDYFVSKGAFEWCVKLKSIRIPNNVKRIGPNSFANCRNLVSVKIEEGVEEVWDSAFENCNSLQSIVIPGSISHIQEKVFKGCKQLTSVVLSEGVRTIEKSVFEDCDIQTIVFPKSVKYIRPGAFANNENLHIVDLPKSVEEVGSSFGDRYDEIGAFQGCNGITSLYIPGNVKRIGSNTFKDCKNILSVVIGEGVRIIGHGVFRGCERLKSISFPASVESVGEGVFLSCYQLEEIFVPIGEKDRFLTMFPEDLWILVVEKDNE